MNKLKLLYDVVKTLRSKDTVNGEAVVDVQKDQVQIFYAKNQFEKNLATMQTKATITTEVNYEGKQVKHHSTTEFTNHCPQEMHHRFFRHMHPAGSCCRGMKAKLAKLAFVLKLLDKIQVEEHADKTALVTLDISELPEDIKALAHERMQHASSCHPHGPHCFAKELCSIEKGNFSFAMSVKANHEIDKIVVTFDGIQNNEQNEQHVLNIKGELQLF